MARMGGSGGSGFGLGKGFFGFGQGQDQPQRADVRYVCLSCDRPLKKDHSGECPRCGSNARRPVF